MDLEITLRVNGAEHPLVIDTRTTLLDALRERLGLTGPKKGCDHGQCGYCTPGQLCSAVGMLREAEAGWPSAVSADLTASHITLDDEEIRERMSGNLCRCAAYANIVPAIKDVAQQAQEVLETQQPEQEARR